MPYETKALDFPFELKALTEDGSFEGYGSVFDVLDSDREVVVQDRKSVVWERV